MAHDQMAEAISALRAANPIAEPLDRSSVDRLSTVRDRDQFVKVLGASQAAAGNVRSLADHRRRRHRSMTTAAVVAIVVAATAAWTFIERRAADDPMSVLCLNQPETFKTADPNAADPLQGVSTQFVGDPLERCAEAWTKPEFDNQPPQPAPPLVGCVLDSGVLAVLPGASGTVCDELHLPRWSGRFRDDAASITAVAGSLTEWIGSQPCADGVEAAARARDGLAAVGLTKWNLLTAAQPTPGQSCAVFGFDFARRVLEILYTPQLRG